MRKLKLESLTVDSFDTTAAMMADGKGTVQAQALTFAPTYCCSNRSLVFACPPSEPCTP
jgi:hypothetical protein